MRRLTRRTFLNASGIVAGTGMLSLGTAGLLRRLARGAPPGGPKRFMTLYMPNSSIRNLWLSQGGRNVDGGTGDATDFTLNTLTEPFAPIREHLTLIHGINLDDLQGDNHSSAHIRITTGEGVESPNAGDGGGNLPRGPSLDTLAALESPLIAADETAYKQLVLSCDTRGPSLHHRCTSADLNADFIPPENDPKAVADRIFANIDPNASAEEQLRQWEALKARKTPMLDFLQRDLDRMRARSPAAQHAKVDSHAAAIAGLQAALEAPPPLAGEVELPTGLEDIEPNRSADHPRIVSGFLDIVRAAFQLDLTRVVSFAFGSGNNAVSFADFGDGPDGGIHNIAHDDQDQETQDKLSEITLWYVSRVTEFVQSLAAIPEGDGTMLDNTLIFFFSEVGQWHEHDDVPLALIGGRNLGNVGNRCLRYDRQVNDVGMAILQALQVPRTSFGNEDWFTGAAPELFV